MPKTTKRTSPYKSNGATLGFEEKLWAAADKLRAHMDAAEYKHSVLGLIFLKYISDAFETRRLALKRDLSDFYDRDEKLSRTLFTIVKDDEMVRRIVAATRSLVGDLDQPDTGLMVVLPVEQTEGLDKKP